MRLFSILMSSVFICLSLPITAQAIPSFSRQIQADCRTCHFIGNKSLNKFGREFKINAFHETEEMRNRRLKLESESGD